MGPHEIRVTIKDPDNTTILDEYAGPNSTGTGAGTFDEPWDGRGPIGGYSVTAMGLNNARTPIAGMSDTNNFTMR